jgi:hypothetical protein
MLSKTLFDSRPLPSSASLEDYFSMVVANSTMTRHVKQELAFGGNQSQLQALPAATVNLPAINGKRESGPTTIPARSLDALSEARFQQSE